MIDCDVHVAPASYQDLFPYLCDYWRQYITEAGVRLNGMVAAYPPGAPTSASPAARAAAGPPTPDTYEAMSAALLERTEPR